MVIGNYKSNIILISLLTILSGLIYLMQFLIFHQTRSSLFYFFQDLAFVPIQVMMVTIILNRFLNIMEKRKKIKKINVIIATFYVDAGTTIMKAMSEFNKNNDELIKIIKIEGLNKKKEYLLKKEIREFEYNIYAEPEKLEKLKMELNKYREFTLHMLGNDNLLEHDSFTDMLWAVFHVNDELNMRKECLVLTQGDIDHLSSDILRAYSRMILEWVNYLQYLQDEYPFLYMIAIKKAVADFEVQL